MKRWKKICLGALLILMVSVTSVAVWQQENLKALYMFLKNDSQSLSQDLEDKRQQQQDTLNKDYNVTVQAPSKEQTDNLLDGKVTPEDVKEELGLSQGTGKDPDQTQKPDQSTTGSVQQPDLSEGKEVQDQIDALVNQCTSELYACEVDLMAQLGAMKQAALEEWRALPESERTKEKKMEIGFAGLEKCYDLEVATDEKVEDILEKYRAPLEELGADTTVLKDLWNYYCEKKVREKAYYMNKYLD